MLIHNFCEEEPAMAWITYKKAYAMVPHSWLIEVMDMFGVAGNIAGLLRNSMAGWKNQLMGNGNQLSIFDIIRVIFQGDSLSPLMFVMIMTPLSIKHRDSDLGYMLKNDRSNKINHLLYG